MTHCWYYSKVFERLQRYVTSSSGMTALIRRLRMQRRWKPTSTWRLSKLSSTYSPTRCQSMTLTTLRSVDLGRNPIAWLLVVKPWGEICIKTRSLSFVLFTSLKELVYPRHLHHQKSCNNSLILFLPSWWIRNKFSFSLYRV